MNIKNLLLFIISLFFSILEVHSQDVIVKRDGSTILAKVQKVGDKQVEYKKYNSKSDRLYTISTEQLMCINYEDGEKDTFNQSVTEAQNAKLSSTTKPEVVVAGAENDSLINQINKDIVYIGMTNKKAKSYMYQFGVKENSILTDDVIKVRYSTSFDYGWISGLSKFTWENWESKKGKQDIEDSYLWIEIENLSNEMIYVDLAESFQIIGTNLFPMYKSVTHSSSSSETTHSGVLSNLILNITSFGTEGGSSSSDGKTRSESFSRIVAIVPHTIVLIPSKEFRKNERSFDIRDGFIKPLPDLKTLGSIMKSGNYITWDKNGEMSINLNGTTTIEDTSNLNKISPQDIFNMSVIISYVKESNKETYRRLKTEFFLKKMYAYPATKIYRKDFETDLEDKLFMFRYW